MIESDVETIKYFWRKYQCLSRCVTWKDIRERVVKENPVLIKAIEDFELQEDLVSQLIDHLEPDYEEDELS